MENRITIINCLLMSEIWWLFKAERLTLELPVKNTVWFDRYLSIILFFWNTLMWKAGDVLRLRQSFQFMAIQLQTLVMFCSSIKISQIYAKACRLFFHFWQFACRLFCEVQWAFADSLRLIRPLIMDKTYWLIVNITIMYR